MDAAMDAPARPPPAGTPSWGHPGGPASSGSETDELPEFDDTFNLLTATPDEAALAIACFLITAADLLSLLLACRRFNIKCIVFCGRRGGPAAAAPETLSIVEEAARRWVASCSEQVHGWMPRRSRESLLGLMREVHVLRLPLVFGRSHADLTLSDESSGHGGDEGDFYQFDLPGRGGQGGDAIGSSFCAVRGGGGRLAVRRDPAGGRAMTWREARKLTMWTATASTVSQHVRRPKRPRRTCMGGDAERG
jgi:hypothetical protein